MTDHTPHASPQARHALAEDLPALEVALATAFADDPMISWVVGDGERERRIRVAAPGFFRPALAAGIVRGHTYTVPDRSGAAIWSPPDVPMFREDEGMAFGTAIVEQLGEAAMHRLMALSELVGSQHPRTESHFYLFILGAAVQGRGVGAAVMRPVLDRCDADRLPAYLESSSDRNVPFYERLGFRITWTDRPTPDGPVLRGMWRDPR
ncbi:MAG: GNAT family N-acetyltransferase [Acidimicrobiales bacterium]|nr:GNAT family N-acetyltransferase [Acidimicrobiales bacterium]MCB9394716.1 GNAT family N-acetyltransferase [Acidimicrobiaceae bacterium]